MTGAQRAVARMRLGRPGRTCRLVVAAAVVLALAGCVPIGVRVQNMFSAMLG
jgi:hypothetical protein